MLEIVCDKHLEGFTEHTRMVNFEEVVKEKGLDPKAVLTHLSVVLSTGVKCVDGKWLVKGRRTEATLQSLIDTYVPTCRDCTSRASYGSTVSRTPTHCRIHREPTMILC